MSNSTFYISTGYTYVYGAGCLGNCIGGYEDFYAARDACDKDKECGCFQSLSCNPDVHVTTHRGFKLLKSGLANNDCAWVRI